MKTINAAWVRCRALCPPVSVALLFFPLLLENLPARAADANQAAKAEADPQTKTDAKKSAVRIIVLKGNYADYPSTSDIDPISLFFGGLERPGSFFDLCEKIDDLARDEEIQHVLFDLSSSTLHLNLAQLSEVSRHVRKLREAGKRSFAWLENADTIHYAIASACDTILMTDLGSLDLPSLSLMTLHFRDAMDLLGAKASFARTGDFKGAVEPFTLSEMSEQLRAHYKSMGGGQERRANKPAIAVLHLDGQILDGEKEMPGMLVSGPTVQAIQELESDDNVRAVVARINSPGGSATASEAVRAALEKLSKNKPTLISMGDMAASGGYWISCVGRPVYAEPETLTGSIGVFALKLSFGQFLKKIGLKMESVTLDESAGAMAMDRGWTTTEQERMQGFVDDIYDKFLRLVASSRKLKVEQISPIAGGRVWSGAQARKLGLVDQLGGLDEALAASAREAGLEPGYQIIHRPRKKNLFELFDLFGESTDEIRSSLSPAARKWLREAGFDLSVPLNLARESLSGGPPKIWLLAPTVMVIR